ncbi:hypothetical protein IH601_10915 [Candidatus Bipolaricaulota bacterium]|jgi:alkylhydroperoxidase family enzyme|nr:hypothetical protein [Candidatus Bipolaricaulota bacterium]TFH11066.1 MAG: hypothetical protein E4H08_02205 [Candidatus Atribacteria bacterium]
MRRTISRAFVAAQAFVGVTLTVSWLLGRWDPQFMALPLFGLVAILLACALFPESWTQTSRRLAAQEKPAEEDHRRVGPLQRAAVGNRSSVDCLMIAGFLLATVLLLYFVAPVPMV